MKSITRTFSSPDNLKRWLEDKYAECGGTDNFNRWLTTFYDTNNNIEVNGIIYTLTECMTLIQDKPKEEYKKSELTRLAKELTYAHQWSVKTMCFHEEISKWQISKDIILPENSDLLLEIAKRFAKYRKEEMSVDFDNTATQDTVNILNLIIETCEENNWFEGE